MDYQFFVERIGTVSPGILAYSNTECQKQIQGFAQRTPNFREHEGFGSVHSSHKLDWADKVADALASTVIDLFPRETLAEYDINYLRPQARIPEHTDMTGPSDAGWRVNMGHKIHFVLSGNYSFAGHRRCRDVDVTQSRMLEGGVYAYNNYVFHTALNGAAEGTKDLRIHCVLMYSDPKWQLKRNLYTRLGVIGWNF